jgi:3-hydroxyisobutyrate dehydrogenase-like beta-hydroxyacid dehydrogenase
MLPNGKIVDSVYEGDVIGKAPKGAILLDCSTIDVDTARKVDRSGDKVAAMKWSMRRFRAGSRRPMAVR